MNMIEQLIFEELDKYKNDIETIKEKKTIDCITIFSSSENDYKRLNNELSNNKLIDQMTSGNLYYLNEPIKTNAKLVVNYLNILVRESWIANEQINQALSKIDVCKKENVWLLLYYIEAQKIIEKVDYYKVKIDIPMIEKMLEKADPALKNDYTVLRIKERVKEKYGYDIKF